MQQEEKKLTYKERLKASLEEIDKKDEAFKKAKKKLYRWTSFGSLGIIVIVITLIVLFKEGILPNADLIFVPLMAVATFLMVVRYYTVNRRLYIYSTVLAIAELAFAIYLLFSKIKGGLI